MFGVDREDQRTDRDLEVDLSCITSNICVYFCLVTHLLARLCWFRNDTSRGTGKIKA